MAVIAIDVNVLDIESVLSLFDNIEVWRAVDDITFVEITAPAPTHAQLTGTLIGPWSIVGAKLSIEVNGEPPTVILFRGPGPLDGVAVTNQINAVIPNLASEVNGVIVLTAPLTGSASNLHVTGDAVAFFDFPTIKVMGLTGRIRLTSPTTSYVFHDYSGDGAYLYKTRYSSSITQAISSFSDPRQGSQDTVLPATVLTKVTVNLADAAGRPIVGRRVIFVPLNPQSGIAAGQRLYGVLPGFDRLITTTDSTGYAEMNLLMGETFRVFIEGSYFSRDFVAPNVATFDLLTIVASVSDPFDIATVPPRPIRGEF